MTVMLDGRCAYEIVKKCGCTYASVGITVSYIFKFVYCISGEVFNLSVSLYGSNTYEQIKRRFVCAVIARDAVEQRVNILLTRHMTMEQQ